jgi:geranylgeranyl pyrophosphate synthase
VDPAILLADVRREAVALSRDAWPELGALVDAALPEPMDPVALIPVASGLACGAEPEGLVPAAAAIVLAAVALRVVDDCADRDNPAALDLAIGPGRAINAAVALGTVSARALGRLPLPAKRREGLVEAHAAALLRVCQGQDHELNAPVATLDDYRSLVRAKTVAAYEFAAAAGAMVATSDMLAQARCRGCGAHLGWLTQILDDVEALWFPDGPDDLSLGRLTFPLLHGLSLDHPLAPALRGLFWPNEPDPPRVRELLDRMQVRRDLLSQALDHRDEALAALAPPLDPRGQALLRLWLDWLFRDGERLLGEPPSDHGAPHPVAPPFRSTAP